jgi:hypothetical protein
MQDEASMAAARASCTALDEASQKAVILKRLRTALDAKRLVIVTGVGVTLDATGYVRDGDLEYLTWKGLIEHGFRYLERMCRPAISDEKKTQERTQKITNGRYLLSQPDTDSHLLAAQILRKELEGEDHFANWLDSVFDNLEIKNEVVLRCLKALHAKGATLLTTNYDHILDRYCNLDTIRRTATDDLLRFRRGRASKDGVFHIHGSYQDPDDVVLDPIDYYKVKMSTEVQSFLQKCLLDDTVLFVGCGDGLGDANFSALLTWITEKHRKIAHAHCLLITEGDHYNFKPLVRLKYGARHSDLGPWLLKELLGDSPETEDMNGCTSGGSNGDSSRARSDGSTGGGSSGKPSGTRPGGDASDTRSVGKPPGESSSGTTVERGTNGNASEGRSTRNPSEAVSSRPNTVSSSVQL